MRLIALLVKCILRHYAVISGRISLKPRISDDLRQDGPTTMDTDRRLIEAQLIELGLSGRDVAVHASLRSFGHVNGGADTVVQALLGVCGTVLMPTFCGIGRTNAPDGDRPEQNAWDYSSGGIEADPVMPFDPATFDRTSDLDVAEMGQIPVALLRQPNTFRSQHPSVSWAANGPRATDYTADHLPDDPNRPLKRLAEREGYVLLLGVDLSVCTAAHLGEELAGRKPFIRWVLYADGTVRRVREYGCSDGFGKLDSYVEAMAKRCAIAACSAVCYPIKPFIEAFAQVIKSQPEITLCGRLECRCVASHKGGPLERVIKE